MLPLSEILTQKLIPWSQQDAGERFIVARAKMRQAEMPSGVHLSRHKLEPPRVVVKNRRSYNNVRDVIAEWPAAGLHEIGKYLLICVLDGHVTYQVGGYKLRCGAGYFLFIPPSTPCPDGSRSYVDLEKSDSCDIISFLQHPNALECWMSHGHARGREKSNGCLTLHARTISLFQSLMEEVVAGEEHSTLIGQDLLSAFLRLLQREADAGRLQFMRAQARAHELRTEASDFGTRLEHYVRANLHQSLSLDHVSREMYLSPAQFTRNVRRETGQSFNELLAHYRMEAAKELLLNSQWAITAIASFVGFKSPSYFRTFFKRYTGLSPLEFRARASRSGGSRSE